MRGDLINGFTVLADSFPPSLNTSDDPTKLKTFESPSVHGAAVTTDGLLSVGTIPTAQTNPITQYTVGGHVYDWHYNRLWRSVGTILFIGAPNYTDAFVRQGLAEIPTDETIIQFQPCFQSDMWLMSSSGSYFLKQANRIQTEREPERWVKDFYTTSAGYAAVLNGIPYVSNARGVFSHDGQALKEVTRAVRYVPGIFASSALSVDFERQYLIGPNWCIDTQAGKLFDFSTTGFSFMSRTLTQAGGFPPFAVERVVFNVVHSDENTGGITWQTSFEEDDFVVQQPVNCVYDQDQISRIDVAIDSDVRTAHKFRLQITGMDSNIAIRSIEVLVRGLSIGSFSE